MKRKILLLIILALLLLEFSFLLKSLNESNFITAFVVYENDFNNIEKLSTVIKQGESLAFKFNGVNYSIFVSQIKSDKVFFTVGSMSFNLSAKQSKDIDLDKDTLPDLSLNLDNVLSNQASITIERLSCLPNWFCESFGECKNAIQTRECYDINKCQSPSFVPELTQPCVESCNDNLNNQDETGIDCGGSKCEPCKESSSYVYFWAAIPIVIAIIVIIITLILTKKTKHQVIEIKDFDDDKKIQDLGFQQQTQAQIKEFQISKDDKSIIELQNYIEMALIKNFDSGQIKAKLLEVGWPDDVIDQNIAIVKKKLGKP